MEKTNTLQFSVSELIALTNQTLEFAYANVEVEGEVSGFKVNQNKYVFFDLKDEQGSVSCFMTVWQLRTPIEDGMKVVVVASPKLTPWGKFSLTVQAIRPRGEGSIKKSFELLRGRLEKEGLFDEERKRPLPELPQRIGVISSTQAAGYADFIKILNDRWGGLTIEVAQVQVQGVGAPEQMIEALRYFNTQDKRPDVIVLIRGGGSADDLSSFNDELLVREIAASRVPTLVGVGHETDVSLADMVADLRAATPSNAAQLLVPDRHETIRHVKLRVRGLLPRIEQMIEDDRQETRDQLERAFMYLEHRRNDYAQQLTSLRRLLAEFDPHKVLLRGYALVRGDMVAGGVIEIEKNDMLLQAEVKNVRQK